VIDPIFLAEAAVNGILLGGVLALLALGLNLIFGVLDIVWIAYVDMVMICMYAVYFLVMTYGWPVWAAGLGSLALGGLLGITVHVLIISPILKSPPVNQLLERPSGSPTVAMAPTHDSRQMFCFTRPTAIKASSSMTPRLSFVPTTRPPKFVFPPRPLTFVPAMIGTSRPSTSPMRRLKYGRTS
jgi:hypothetical protein